MTTLGLAPWIIRLDEPDFRSVSGNIQKPFHLFTFHGYPTRNGPGLPMEISQDSSRKILSRINPVMIECAQMCSHGFYLSLAPASASITIAAQGKERREKGKCNSFQRRR
jgi:hypothetical protein